MRKAHAFTLIELLVVMAIIATLLSLVAPRYFRSVDKAKETALQTNLKVMRDAIDKFHADARRHPASLEELVARRYLREIPLDPVTERRDTWHLLGADARGGAGTSEACAAQQQACGGIGDVRSGAAGSALDGTAFSSW